MEALTFREPEERPGVLGFTPEKISRKQASEPVGSSSSIRSLGRNVCFPQTPGVRAPGRTFIMAGGHN